MTVSPYVKRMAPLVARQTARYPNLVYVPQDIDTLELLVWGEPVADVAPDDARPVHPDHPLFREDRVRFFVDPRPGSTSWPPATSPSARASTARSRGSSRAPRRSCSPTTRGRSSWPATSRSPTGACATRRAGHRRRRAVRRGRSTALVAGHAERYRAVHGLPRPARARPCRPLPGTDPRLRCRAAATPWPPAVTVASRVEPSGLAGRARRWRRRAKRLARVARRAPGPGRPGPAHHGRRPRLIRPRRREPGATAGVWRGGPTAHWWRPLRDLWGPLRRPHPVDRECPTGGSRQGGRAVRTRRLALATVALVVAACSGGTSSSPQAQGGPRPPHPSTTLRRTTRGSRPSRCRPRTAGSPTRTRAPTPTSTPTRTASRPSPSTSTRRRTASPALRRRRAPARPGQHPGRGVGQRLRPRLRRAARRRRLRRPSSTAGRRRSATADEVVAAHRPAGARRARPPARPGGPDLRHRHVRLDGARGAARDRQGRPAPARRRSRPGGLGGHRHVRR